MRTKFNGCPITMNSNPAKVTVTTHYKSKTPATVYLPKIKHLKIITWL